MSLSQCDLRGWTALHFAYAGMVRQLPTCWSVTSCAQDHEAPSSIAMSLIANLGADNTLVDNEGKCAAHYLGKWC